MGTVSISGANAADFVASAVTPSTIGTGTSGTFTVTGDPSAVGTRVATVQIPNNDPSISDYLYSIEMEGLVPEPPEISLSYWEPFGSQSPIILLPVVSLNLYFRVYGCATGTDLFVAVDWGDGSARWTATTPANVVTPNLAAEPHMYPDIDIYCVKYCVSDIAASECDDAYFASIPCPASRKRSPFGLSALVDVDWHPAGGDPDFVSFSTGEVSAVHVLD